MGVEIDRAAAPVRSITLFSRRGGHDEKRRNIIAKCAGAPCVFTVSIDSFGPANIEVPRSEALAFADYLKEMCS